MAFSSLASAQFTFSTNLAYHKETEPESSYFEFAPSVGYTFDNSMEFGLYCTFAKFSDIDDPYLGFGGYARWYALDLTDNLSLFVDCNVYHSWMYEENEGNEEEPTPEYSLDKSTYTGVSLVPGLCYQISDHFSLDLMLNLANITWELDKSIPCNSDKKADMKNATENSIFHFGGYATSYNNAEDIDNLVSVGVSYNF